jgi:hypothetical protein
MRVEQIDVPEPLLEARGESVGVALRRVGADKLSQRQRFLQPLGEPPPFRYPRRLAVRHKAHRGSLSNGDLAELETLVNLGYRIDLHENFGVLTAKPEATGYLGGALLDEPGDFGDVIVR